MQNTVGNRYGDITDIQYINELKRDCFIILCFNTMMLQCINCTGKTGTGFISG
jgi:hypothetical protein